MTDLLARASRHLNEDLQDFAPKRGSSRVRQAGRPAGLCMDKLNCDLKF
jgi:hypothetical protein